MKRRHFLQALACAPWLLPGLTGAAQPAWFGREAIESSSRGFAAGAPVSLLVHCLAPETLIGGNGRQPAASGSLSTPEDAELPVAGRSSAISLKHLLSLAPTLIADIDVTGEARCAMVERICRQSERPFLLYGDRLAESPTHLRDASRSFDKANPVAALASHSAVLIDRMPVSISAYERVAEATIERLADLRPDIVLCQDETLYRYILASNRQMMPALRANRVYRVPAVPFGWYDGPAGIDRLLGLLWLSALLDERRTRELPERVTTLFRLFYRVEPGPQQVVELLSGHPGVLV